MNRTRVLIDTNVLIALEDPGRTDPLVAEFSRRCLAGGIDINVHPLTRDDFARDPDGRRREVSISRMGKFSALEPIPAPEDARLEARFGAIKSANDRVDVALLHALSVDAADLLVTQDEGIHRRVRGEPSLAERVVTLADAVAWLISMQDPVDDGLAHVADVPTYAVDVGDPIFDGLRADYPDFPRWWRDHCVRDRRRCWTVSARSGRLDGIIVRKVERGEEIGESRGSRVLKLCTFKVAASARGHRMGELLLRKALWHAQLNGFDALYLTAFPKHALLLDLLDRYGFERRRSLPSGEQLVLKPVSRRRLEVSDGDPAVEARRAYPRFRLDDEVGLFAIPIQWRFHRQLFPEAAWFAPLPLFGEPVLYGRDARTTAGNTIRKVYVCRSATGRMKGGDVIFFYQSKDAASLHSQSLTTVGVVEQVRNARDDRELSRMTAGRSVFSEVDLKGLAVGARDGVTVIDFLHVQHLRPMIPLEDVMAGGVLRAPPQAITPIRRAGLPTLRRSMDFGFDL